MPRSAAVVASMLATLALACGRPPAQVAVGEAFTHPEAGFSLIVPDGWHLQETRAGVALVRELPYGGGYPTLKVRRVDATEATALSLDGATFTHGGTRTEYRYQAWNNARGRGWRLEALISTGDAVLFADASIWDEATDLDRKLFETWFWPVVSSLQDPAAP